MIQWNADGLAPAIVQNATTGDVLMLGWMNAESLEMTRSSGFVHFYSRSRKALWKKGETSGAIQHVVSASIDCDQDTLLLKVRPENIGETCHTGRNTCFYREITEDAGQPTGLKLSVTGAARD